MDPDYNATTFQIDIDTFGIEGNRYGDDLAFGQGPWNVGTWPMETNELTLSPKPEPIVHAHTVPGISINCPFPLDNSALFDFSPTSYTDTPFHGSIQTLHRDGSWETFSQQSDGCCSMQPSLRNDGNWDTLSQLSDSNHGRLRSLSFGDSSDIQFMDGLHDPMTSSTTALQAQSLPIRFEDFRGLLLKERNLVVGMGL